MRSTARDTPASRPRWSVDSRAYDRAQGFRPQPNSKEQESIMTGQILNWNFRLLSHHELSGFGNVGEGIAQQKTKDGRYILWMAHEGPPKAYTGLDVTDPRAPKM